MSALEEYVEDCRRMSTRTHKRRIVIRASSFSVRQKQEWVLGLSAGWPTRRKRNDGRSNQLKVDDDSDMCSSIIDEIHNCHQYHKHTSIFRELISNGVPEEKDYAFKGVQESCREHKAKIKIKSYATIPAGFDNIKNYLINNGPLVGSKLTFDAQVSKA